VQRRLDSRTSAPPASLTRVWRWPTGFSTPPPIFTERYLSYVASIGVKLFVLYLIMGVGMSIAGRWIPVLERGGFSPIPFFYVMGGSLVFVFLTWHIPSVAGSMMAGAVSLSLADAVYPAIWGSRAAGAAVLAAGAVGGAAVAAGRWGVDRLRVHTSLHTGNGQVPTSQSAAAATTAPPPNASTQAGNTGSSELGRPRTSTQTDRTRDSGRPSKDPNTPSDTKGADSTTDDSRSGDR
jgi:type IV secretion system protein TrbL